LDTRSGPAELTLAALTPEATHAFRNHLEQSRGNGPRTRNCRLAAIRAFTRFVLGLAEPGVFVDAWRLLRGVGLLNIIARLP
jgi:hypothetical protein